MKKEKDDRNLGELTELSHEFHGKGKKKEDKKKKFTKKQSAIEYVRICTKLNQGELEKLDRYAKKCRISRCEMLIIMTQNYIDKHTGKTKTGRITRS